MNVYDVAIAGGGAAGSAAALALLQGGVSSVCIVENSTFEDARIGESIPPDTNLLLSQLGVRDAFLDQNHLPCYGSHSLWGSNRLGHNDFLTSPYGHGWHLDRTRFDRMLLEQAVAYGADWIPESCSAVRAKDNRIEELKAGDREITAKHFIDATGRRAVLARALGISHRFDDRQVVIWARFRTKDRPLGGSTWLEAVPDGWWYAADLPGNEAIAAFGTDPHLAKAGGLYDLKTWAVALSGTALIAPRLGFARLLPDSFRISSSHSYLAGRASGDNWFAVGDAASAFDPLSSAGIHKALMSGQLAAQAIIEGDGSDYDTRIRADYTAYLDKRAELYEAEQRWPGSGFWSARQMNSFTRDSINPG